MRALRGAPRPPRPLPRPARARARPGPGLGGAGEASAYDFRNVDLGGSVSVDVLGSNGLLDGTGQPTSTSANIIAASAYATAHGLGSLFGLRDVDSFGPISGTVGILDPPGAASFSPAFPGPMNATETVNHLMASAGLLGAGNFDVTADLFLSERSAIKLAFNETGRFVVEQAAAHGSLTPSGSQPMTLRALSVPNTLESGANADRTLNVEAAAIIGGQVGVAGEVDVYSFEGTGGQVVSIEVLSEWLTRAIRCIRCSPGFRMHQSMRYRCTTTGTCRAILPTNSTKLGQISPVW